MKKKVQEKQNFLSAIVELEKSGISREVTIQALKDAFESVLKKKNYEDIIIRTDIDIETGVISIYNVRKIVENVEDAALEISREEAELEVKEDNGTYIDENDQLNSPIEIKEFTRSEAAKFKSIFTQKINEAEKANTYAAYYDKVGELVSGYVEKVDDRYTLINLGRTSVALQDKNKIGDETFKPGDLIKVYLSEVNSSTKGPQITVSRSDKNFLKRLFEEEIHEIFTGVVVINDIAREAGLRSKVSVSSTDSNVDPVGACIGQGGSKIQKICNQINREKVDIIQHFEYSGLFVAEALKPAQVVGIKIDEEAKKAIAVIKDGETRVAIGTKGVNARLAVKLTHYSIDIIEESEALKQGIEFETIDKMKAKEEQVIFEKRREAILAEQAREEEERRIRAEEELNNQVVEKDSEEVQPVETIEETIEPSVEEEIKEEPQEIIEEVKEETVEYKPVVMGQKISLSELEKQIEEEKKKNVSKPVSRKFKKEEVEEKEEVKEKTNPTTYMNIYTDEELEEMEDEEEYEYDDEDIDYTEYDEYYEDN